MNLLSDSESYGYEIVRKLDDITVLSVSESTLYPILARLRREGYLRVRLVPSESGPSRRYFSLTQMGTTYLQQMNDYWDELKGAIDDLRNQDKAGVKR